VESIKNVTQKVKDAFGPTTTFPTMGNHDTYPQDQVRIGGKYVFEKAIKQWNPTWKDFMDNEDSQDTWIKYGYFHKQLTNSTRVLSLNSNICYNLNFQSWVAFSDSGNQFAWLID